MTRPEQLQRALTAQAVIASEAKQSPSRKEEIASSQKKAPRNDKEGIQEIWVVCTHGVFVRGGLERLVAVPEITEIVTTDTVLIPAEKRHPKLHVLSVASIFGEAIRRNYMRQSIGSLFVYGEESS
jgi:hypothetical protein